MNFILKPPSLEHISLINFVTMLWNQRDIRALLTEFSKSPRLHESDRLGRKRELQEIENRVSEKMLQFIIPPCLKEKIPVYILTIGEQILIWIEYHLIHCHLDLGLPNEFSWTPHGTIDKKKTAEGLISDDSIDITTRFKLACIYCLEDDYPKLWNKMPESRKEFFCNIVEPRKILPMELIEYWVLYISGEKDRLRNIVRIRFKHVCSSYEYTFECAAKNGSKAATEYFFTKTQPKEII